MKENNTYRHPFIKDVDESEVNNPSLFSIGFKMDKEADNLYYTCQKKDYGNAIKTVSLVYYDDKMFIENIVEYVENGVCVNKEQSTQYINVLSMLDVMAIRRMLCKQ